MEQRSSLPPPLLGGLVVVAVAVVLPGLLVLGGVLPGPLGLAVLLGLVLLLRPGLGLRLSEEGSYESVVFWEIGLSYLPWGAPI